ncbi:carboxypeptidase regulatory-like domain-containing protein [Segetibacter sp.]|uniref:TonB-dependent receptor n=1 Tax=Segetibacter sp. TaxID=2231182 RepID=UPI0026300F00|nr:carboxypeptidase regulatory-like domain-containing protein [Segetibacter sp.]MCW3082525.1 TonB-dependent receptor [Segetibacter sp.]
MFKSLFILLLILFGILFYGRAQTTQASISGVVLNNEKKPQIGASVTVRNESTGFTTKALTNAQGEYTFKELPLGGPYTLTVTFVGYGEQKISGYTLNQGDAVRANIDMQIRENTLEVVQVVASGLKNKIENIGAATAISARTMTRLPVNGRNFTTLMDLSPLTRGGNIAGQLGSSTNYTIDGMNAKNPTSAGSTTSRSGAPYSISIEAVREFKVVTNQYDVTYGRSGGGTVSAVTKSGTNTLSGSAFSYVRDNRLASSYDIRGNKRNNNYSTNQYGFSLGGPIIKDKLHYFVAWDHQQDKRSLVIADVQSPADETRFNVTKATLDNFVSTARSRYGVSDKAQYGSFDKNRGSDAAFARLDWQINSRNLLTIRDNYTNDRNKLGLTDNTAINLYESTGNDFNRDNSLLATLRTSVSSRVTNELKVQHLYTFQSSEPGDDLPGANIPRAIVENVTSTIGGATRSTNIQIGGHRFAQEDFENNVLQVVNNLYYNTNKIKYTFGIDGMNTRSHSRYGSEVNGRFHYINLAAFENNTPYRYYREVPIVADPSVVGNIQNIGVYTQMQTTLAPGLDFTAGLRFDYAHYPSSPLNQLVLDELNLRTDHKLKSSVIQPRFQFTWDVNEKRTDFIRFGAGVFASDINNYALINNLVFDGKHSATVDVRAPNIPGVDFNAYRADPSKIPALTDFQLPTINTNGPDAQVPVMYKANISYSHYFTAKLKMGITGFATLGRHNYMYVDRNMASQPFFTLANEDSRGVYVPLNTMPANGAGDWLEGRISKKLGRVLELNSKGKVNQFAVVVDGTYQYFRDGDISFSYTWNDTRDNTSYNGNVANTATLSLPVKDDPRDLSKMSYSDNHFRHKVVVYGSLPTFYGVSIGIRYSGIGGTRYSLLSGANSNADFVSGTNDLAFIFDPNNPTVPQNVRTGLTAILNNPDASPSIKNFITEHYGKIAERNGGVNNFYGIIDVRVSKKFKLYKTHNLELSADLFNVANVFDRNRGVNKSLGNQNLYAIGIPATSTSPALPAFDATNRRFNYRVNTAGIVTPSGDPFQVQIGLRYNF